MELARLRRTAAEIAAAAVYELYPDVELLGGEETSTGFFYDFTVPHPIQIEVVEERMRQIVREKRPIRTLEMVSFSAAELLKKEGRLARIEELGEGLVQLIQIGTFYDLSSGPHLKNTAELAAFKISLEPLSKKRFRINGWCHSSKDELKHYLKKLAHYHEPQLIGEERGLWKGKVWLSEGLRLRQKLINFLKKEWFENAFEVAGTEESERTAFHKALGRPKVAEISLAEMKLQVSFFQKTEEEWISFLHSIAKTLTILGFDHSIQTHLNGQEIEYVIEDGIDRSHSVVLMKKISGKKSLSKDYMLAADIEKIFHLLLEKNLMVNIENQ